MARGLMLDFWDDYDAEFDESPYPEFVEDIVAGITDSLDDDDEDEYEED